MNKAIIIPFIFALFVSGCATFQHAPMAGGTAIPTPGYHRVARGETLWSIAQRYGINQSDIIRANDLSNPRNISAGQRLIIPKSTDRCAVIPEEPKVWGTTFLWPVNGEIRSRFEEFDCGIPNTGIDIAVRNGEQVRAARSGRVAFRSDRLIGFEKALIIDHGDEFQTVYAYNADILVNEGVFVRQNDVIAKAGRPRRGSEPLVHFEIRKNGRPQDPLRYLPKHN